MPAQGPAAGAAWGRPASREPIAQGAVGADPVVVVSPPFDQNLHLLHRKEDLPIQEFVPQVAIEGFVVTVLPGTPRLHEQGLPPEPVQPAPDDLGAELGAVVERGAPVTRI